MKKTVKLLLSILIFVISLNHAEAQNLNSLTYDVRAQNFTYLDTYTNLDPFVTGFWNVIEFDIYIQQTNVPANSEEIMRFKLGTYYLNMNFGGLDAMDTVGGYASFSYIPGSTTFTDPLAIPTNPKCIAIAATTDEGAFWPDYATGIRGGFLSLSSNYQLGSSSDVQISATFPGTKVGRYRLQKNITAASPSPFFPSEYTHLRWRVTPAINLTNPNPVSKIFCNDGLFGPITDVSDKGTWKMDTISINVYPSLSGNYTIGGGNVMGSVGNYPTIKSAVQDLVLRGVSGPVIFDIMPGTYTEKVTIDSVRGTSSLNTVTFQSQTGNQNDVTWNGFEDYTDTVLVWDLVKLNKADYLTFKNIKFTSNNLKNIFYLNQNCDGIRILNNILTGSLDPSYADATGINSINASTNDLNITGNIIDAFQGIISSGTSHNTQIINNKIIGTYGIYLSNNDSLKIEKNIVSTSAPGFIFINNVGISISNCSEYLKISKNQISAFGDGRFFSGKGLEILNSNCQNSVIDNNFISYGGGTGLTVSNSENINIYFNSIRATGSNSFTGSPVTNLQMSNTIGCTVKNNIFGGVITSVKYNSNTSLISDFNSFYFIPAIIYGVNIVYNGTDFTNFNLYQTASGNDLNSTDDEVFFTGNYDLHLTGSSIGDVNLLGTPIPGINDDIDGDLRNPTSPYMGADEADFPLPVELYSFTSSVSGRDVMLNWRTLSEINNSGFDIDKLKVNGENISDWKKAGFVTGTGTGNNPNEYSFIDKNLNAGSYKYRLKQIDMNGNFEYFYLNNEVTIALPEKYELSQNYPNPFNPSTKINYQMPNDGFVNISVYDNSGREVMTLVNENKTAGYYTVSFNAASLSSGVYFYRIKSDNFNQVKKMMLVK